MQLADPARRGISLHQGWRHPARDAATTRRSPAGRSRTPTPSVSASASRIAFAANVSRAGSAVRGGCGSAHEAIQIPSPSMSTPRGIGKAHSATIYRRRANRPCRLPEQRQVQQPAGEDWSRRYPGSEGSRAVRNTDLAIAHRVLDRDEAPAVSRWSAAAGGRRRRIGERPSDTSTEDPGPVNERNTCRRTRWACVGRAAERFHGLRVYGSLRQRRSGRPPRRDRPRV